MLKSYFLLALRNIFRNKVFSFINIFGLSLGVASSLLVFLYVLNELSYDRFYPHADRVHRLAVEALIGETEIRQTYTSALTYTRMREVFPEVEAGVKLIQLNKIPVTIDNDRVYENSVFLADSTFFKVFPRGALTDNVDLLRRPNTIVLSESSAMKYFGGTMAATGKILEIDFPLGLGTEEFEVTAVYPDFPLNAHFHPSMIFSSSTFPSLINDQGWSSNSFVTYLLLKKGTDPAQFEKKLVEFTRDQIGPEFYDSWTSKGNYWTYFLQPLSSIHLTSDLNGEFENNGNLNYVKLFLFICVFILIVASINFMNLTTARASVRAREIGMRKVYGAHRRMLVRQFMGETLVISLLSVAIGLLLVWLILPVYGHIVGKEIKLSLFAPWQIISILLGITVVLGIFSGMYPSFVLSSLRITDTLKGSTGDIRKGLAMRRILVVLQFAIAIGLMVGSLAVMRQMMFLQKTELGFTKEAVFVIENPGQISGDLEAFMEDVRGIPGVKEVCTSNFLPGREFANVGFGAEGIDDSFTLNIGRCEPEFIDVLGLKMVQGRFFMNNAPSDSGAVVLNQAAAKLLGWEEDPLRRKIMNGSSERNQFHVIGVVGDFHYESLHSEIRPMALFLNGGYFSQADSYVVLKLGTGDIVPMMDAVGRSWKRITALPFDYFFLDEDFNNLYKNELQTRRIFIFFSVISILIACLGLFGLASFVSLQRTREIGIRKVLGSSVTGIVFLLNRQFLRWVVLSNVIAWPLSYWIMHKWLQNFAYRTDLTLWIFLSAGCISLLIAGIIVSAQSAYAGMRNPAEALNYD